MNGQGLFFPPSLNQILGLSRETAFCSSSQVARLKMWVSDYWRHKAGVAFPSEKGRLCCWGQWGATQCQCWNPAGGLGLRNWGWLFQVRLLAAAPAPCPLLTVSADRHESSPFGKRGNLFALHLEGPQKVKTPRNSALEEAGPMKPSVQKHEATSKSLLEKRIKR